MKPIISVVIPLYNKEKSIYRTLRSVQNQLEQRFEIIVVNDGSTDNSAAVAQSLLGSGRIISQENAGESAARNRGVLEANTDIIAFLDADDEWKPGFLSHILRLMNNFPDCGAYATFYEIIQPDGKVYCPPLYNKISSEPWIGILPNFFQITDDWSPFNSSSIAIPKKVFTDLGGFQVGVNRGGDTLLWIRLGIKYPIAYSPSRQSIYHQEAENRACMIFPVDGVAIKASLMEKMLEDNDVPFDLIDSFKKYYDNMLIHKVTNLIKEGQPKLARDFLSKIKVKQKYQLIWSWWYLLSFIPSSLISFLNNIRSKVGAH